MYELCGVNWLVAFLLPLGLASGQATPPEEAHESLGAAAQAVVSGDEAMVASSSDPNAGPHDTKGYAFGAQGEYYRYMHMFHKQPTEEDRLQALDVAEKIRCDVCNVMLASLIEKAENLSEDAIADALEGNTDYPKTGEVVKDQMLQHKKGCQKHFKDEVIAEGWLMKTCSDTGQTGSDGRGPNDPCLFKGETKPGEMAIEAYELWKEGVFFACEHTIGRYNDDIASFLADELPSSADKASTLRQACKEQAHCMKPRRKSQASQESKKVKKGKKTKGDKKEL